MEAQLEGEMRNSSKLLKGKVRRRKTKRRADKEHKDSAKREGRRGGLRDEGV